MLNILVASSKGGAGKTTLATNLAAAFAVEGRNTVLVDADRQGSALRWAERRANEADAVLGLAGLRRDWQRQVPADAERVVIDSPAGARAADFSAWLARIDAIVVPVLPSAIDLEALEPFLDELARLPQVQDGSTTVGLVANRLKPWTNASRLAVEALHSLTFPLVAELRDTQGYVLAHALGKGMFDYRSGVVRAHQEDWKPLLRWLKRQERGQSA
ncbi:AAA family ATPase [Dokdonella sp.]|uniref:nucleotide-binding protein n=1 Tax=Dokdonella sp. TaxID=2291710 RepID=UPI0031BF5AE2|nr:ParA family protein [Dokdonella sp.]